MRGSIGTSTKLVRGVSRKKWKKGRKSFINYKAIELGRKLGIDNPDKRQMVRLRKAVKIDYSIK